MTRKTDNAVLNKGNTTNNAKIKIIAREWFAPHYTLSITQQNSLLNQNIKKMTTELQNTERSVFMKEVNSQNFWTFELGTQEGINIPVKIFTVFRQSDREHDQNLNNDTFFRMPVTSAQCTIRTEKNPNSAVLLNYGDDDYSQENGQIKEALRALTEDDILQTYISEDDCRSSSDDDNIGYNIYCFDIRYQKNFRSAQPKKLESKFSENIPPGIYGYNFGFNK